MPIPLSAPLLVTALLLTISSATLSAEPALSLRAGVTSLSLIRGPSRQYGLQLRSAEAVFVQNSPLSVEVVDAQGQAVWLTGSYQIVTGDGEGFRASGDVTSPNGTRIHVVDSWQALPKIGAFTLTRQVNIAAIGPQDTGFSTRFSLTPRTATAMTDCEFFAPGLWYKDNAHVPPKALASHLSDHYFLFREDRLPLPLMMLRDKRSGVTVTLAHLGGNPTTFAGEDGLKRLSDARLGFGSLGILNTDRPSPVFQFPGTEGERTYTFGGSLLGNRWAYRSHPVQLGFSHRYRLLIQLRHTADFPAAVKECWRMVYDLQNPPILKVNLAKVYRDGIGLLETYCRPHLGIPDVPFAAAVPNGDVVDTSSQMGFVGQALPAAWLLLQDSLKTYDAEAQERASTIVDFWAHHSLTPVGVPRTWYDIHPDGTYTWRDYPTFLRVASDGMDGALQAWNVMQADGQDKPEWLGLLPSLRRLAGSGPERRRLLFSRVRR